MVCVTDLSGVLWTWSLSGMLLVPACVNPPTHTHTPSTETDNAVADSLPGQGYEHIVEMNRSFTPASMSLLKKLGRLPESDSVADIICGVVVAIQLFDASAAKRGTGRIIVISHGGMSPATGHESLDSGIVEQLVAQGLVVDIYAVGGWGADAGPQGLPVSSDHDDTSGPQKPPADSLGFRPQLVELAQATLGAVVSVESQIELLGGLRARIVAQRSKYRVDLDIGNGAVRVPIFAYGLTTEAKVPTLKKTTMRAVGASGAAVDPEVLDDGDVPSAGGAGARDTPDVLFERGYMRIPAAGTGGNDVEDEEDRTAEFPAGAAVPSETLGSDDVAKAFRYGSSYVIPVVGDSQAWKLQTGERSFKVLGKRCCGLLRLAR